MPVICHNDPGQANPEPEEALTLSGTPRYGTVRVGAWHQVHPRGSSMEIADDQLADARRPPPPAVSGRSP